MSAMDKIRSFAESREADDVPIREGLTYGDVRDLMREIEGRERVQRHRMPNDRRAVTKRFSIFGTDQNGCPQEYKGYATVGLYDDGSPGELFLRFAKLGGREGRLLDAWATAVSILLQCGVPVETIVDKFSWARFEPSGFTGDSEFPMCQSPLDYICRWMSARFVHKYDEPRAAEQGLDDLGG